MIPAAFALLLLQASPAPAPSAAALAPAGPVVVLETSLGRIRIGLDREKAPATVDNFVQYVEAGHYAGTIFHRVIPGFMAQGGGLDASMNEKGTRAPIRNEANNGLRNRRGTIAMARALAPDSATAQFFISVRDNAALDFGVGGGAGYAVFGEVLEGMDVVDAMVAVPTTSVGGHRDVPVTPVLIKSASVNLPETAPPAWKDLGVDVVFVTARSAHVRAEPAVTAPSLLHLAQGSFLVLVSRQAVLGWYDVIDVESGKKGWVQVGEVEVRYTEKAPAGSPFEATKVDETSHPALYIRNDSLHDMTLTVGTHRFSIPAFSSRTFTVPPGQYHIVASAPTLLPYVVDETLQAGNRYAWNFYIRAITR